MYLLVDGPNLSYRVWHSYPCRNFNDWRDEKGVFGDAFQFFLRSFVEQLAGQAASCSRAAARFGQDLKVLVFWEGERSLEPRRRLFQAYKAARYDRSDKREYLRAHLFMNEARRLFSEERPGFSVSAPFAEADDIIAIFARTLHDSRKAILSTDKDFYQLVDDLTTVVNPTRKGSDRVIDVERVRAELGVLPSQVIDYKALVGDRSDGYPGQDGIGRKRAVEMVQSGQRSLIPDVRRFERDRRLALIPFEGLDERATIEALFAIDIERRPKWSVANRRLCLPRRTVELMERRLQ